MIGVTQTIAASIGICFLLSAVLSSIKKGIYISYNTLFSILIVVDVFIPAIIGAFSGQYLKFPYFNIQSQKYYLESTLLFFLSFLLYGFGYLGTKQVRIRIGTQPNYKIKVREDWMLFFFLFPIFITVLNLYNEYRACGSWEVFYNFKITRAYLITVQYNTILSRIVQITSEFSTTILYMTTAIGFINYKSLKHKDFWKIWAPIITFLISLSALYRGTIVNYACMMLVSIQLKSEQGASTKLTPRMKRAIKRIAVFGVVVFVVYGAVRTNLTAQRWGQERLSLYEATIKMITNTIGTSLVALARCLNYLDKGGNHFFGQSILEMLYSVVPRSLLPSKPTQYGIISITTAMGSPSTVMDAVTIPGELIVNFGLIGVLVFLPIIGSIFKMLEGMRNSPRYKYLYAATVSGFATTSMWMSFSGFFPKIKYFPIYILVSIILLKKEKGTIV